MRVVEKAAKEVIKVSVVVAGEASRGNEKEKGEASSVHDFEKFKVPAVVDDEDKP